jgi:hypothetical protein
MDVSGLESRWVYIFLGSGIPKHAICAENSCLCMLNCRVCASSDIESCAMRFVNDGLHIDAAKATMLVGYC